MALPSSGQRGLKGREMRVEVKLYSILRDCLPSGSVKGKARVSLPEGSTLAELVSHVGIDRRLECEAAELTRGASWQVMVNGRYEGDMARRLQNGDQVHIFPPIVGGRRG